MRKKSPFLFLSCLLALTSCENPFKHQHKFEETYSKNADYHWHAATCEHKDQIKDLEKHDYDAWKVISEATRTDEGIQARKCKVCGYTESETIPVITDEHVHEFGNWVTVREATLDTEGIKARACKTCDFVETDKIEKPAYINGATIEHPFTITEAISFLNSYDDKDDTYTNEKYYVTGSVYSANYSFDGLRLIINFANSNGSINNAFTLANATIDTEYVKESYSVEDLAGKDIICYGYLVYRRSMSSISGNPQMIDLNDENPTIVSISEKAQPHTHTFSSEWTSDSEAHWHASTCEHRSVIDGYEDHTYGDWIVDVAATQTSKGSKHRVCATCNYREDEEIGKIGTKNGTFTLYSFNDFHGAVNEYEDQYHAGLARFGTYLKKVSKNANTLIVDSGDTFQGSIESNYNQGALITDVFNYAHVDVHTLGNHDFDWGEDKITANKAKTCISDGWKATYLGGNIYDYDFATHTEGTTQQSRLGEKYYIKTLENGIKVGVIGTIGLDQITSICSPLVEDICFKDHIEYIKKLSDELRTQKGVDFVIASVHNGAAETIGQGLASVSPVSGKKYCDYVACGHSHKNESQQENGVYYTQAGAYGEMIYKSTFTVSSGAISNVDVTSINYNTIKSETSTIDPNITSIINSYAAEYSSVGSEVIAPSTSGTFYKGTNMSNLLCKAVYEESRDEGYMVDMACCNTARYNLTGSSWTYAQLYEAFPFDNVIYIVKMKGLKNIKEACYSGNSCYHTLGLDSLNTNTWYTFAVIDYLLWHTDSERNYDYFDHSSSNMEILGTLKASSGENYLYRDVCADYVRGLTGTIYASDYSNSATGFNKPTY